MSAAALERRENNSIRRQISDHQFNRRRFNKRMIHQEQKRPGGIPRQRTYSGLKRGDHTFLVIGIEYQFLRLRAITLALRGSELDCSIDLFAMVADNDYSFLDGGTGNRIQDIFEKGSAGNGKKRLWRSHPLGFTGGQNERGYQGVLPHLLCLYRRAEIQVSEGIKQRNKEHQQQHQGNEAKEGLPPKGILQPLGLQGNDSLVGLTKIG